MRVSVGHTLHDQVQGRAGRGLFPHIKGLLSFNLPYSSSAASACNNKERSQRRVSCNERKDTHGE